jgi:uncharacterized membrane protein
MTRTLSARPGFIVGAALAGLFDGIVLHQILQWHHMICIEAHCAVKSVETLQRQTFYDGIFHAAMLAVLGFGLWLLIREMRRGVLLNQQRFWATALCGGGVFNVVEGIVDHHILQIHHVRFGPNQATWDIAFLALGLAMTITGYLLSRRWRNAAGFQRPAFHFIRRTLRFPSGTRREDR